MEEEFGHQRAVGGHDRAPTVSDYQTTTTKHTVEGNCAVSFPPNYTRYYQGQEKPTE